MKNKNDDYSNKKIISLLLSLFSWVIVLGIFYFMLVQFHYESYLDREFGDIGRIFIEANSSWFDPIHIWFLDISANFSDNWTKLIWGVFSLSILVPVIRFTLASLFNDKNMSKILSDILEEIVSEFTGKKRMLVSAGVLIGGWFLIMFACIGLMMAAMN
tara:strand:- start:550 stop:1026 length:477 start_codon:yes stop_codon:yes gene_type:complete